ncbi:hypothetical protein GCM10007424_10420 [Flavobacterium suaedae]|uniref:Ankyrin repeat domain-containing protein n=1 Tax=Flavobacterium suaedae TaxID=1767027 RepID=A0ABQ1JQY2_9FLAO|nr:hypothetical protein [Flavobacterium suaedae]GGB72385.1 hypothetical protein GCM10007424_10420 [Flavobacterium suaedae]
MKKVLLLFMLAFTGTVMASNEVKQKSDATNNTEYLAVYKKDSIDPPVKDTLKTKKQNSFTEEIKDNKGLLSINVFLVDLIHKSNIKIAKRILED